MVIRNYPWLHSRCREYINILGVDHLIKVDEQGNLLNKDEIIKEIDRILSLNPDDILFARKHKLTGEDIFNVYYSK